jgi:hypothetical protein
MQFFLAIAQRHPKLVFQLIKIVKLPPDLREFFVQPAADRGARSHPGTSQFQQVSNLAEGKSKSLHTPDKFQSLDISFAVLTETAGGARRTRQERIPLIEANRIGRQPNLFSNRADLHDMAPSLKTYTLEYSPESSLHSIQRQAWMKPPRVSSLWVLQESDRCIEDLPRGATART